MKLRSIQFLNCNYASEPGTSGGPILNGNRVVGVNSDSFGGHKFSISVIGVCNTLRRWLNMENVSAKKEFPALPCRAHLAFYLN